MRMYRVVPMLVLFLLLSGGQSIQMIERANAGCLSFPWCCWSWIVAGDATVTNPKATITTKELERLGKSLTVEVSQEMLNAFKEEGLLGKPVSGFIILAGPKKGSNDMTITMTGFAPTTREHGIQDKSIPPQEALKKYNEDFEAYVMQSNGKGQKK